MASITSASTVAYSAGAAASTAAKGLLGVFDELCRRSAALPYNFPTKHNLIENICLTQSDKETCADFALRTRPVIVSRMVPLLQEFIDIKRRFGSSVEKTLYATLGVETLLDRLLQKRPLAFMNRNDQFLLKSGLDGAGAETFDRIGCPAEQANPPELRLAELMSYDEIGLAALVSVSTPTFFINDGSRHNMSTIERTRPFLKTGIIVGQVGARFERRYRMEWRHCIVDSDQNTASKGYGRRSEDESETKNAIASASRQNVHDQKMMRAWARFYGMSHFPTYEEALSDASGRFVTYKGLLAANCLFDKLAYERRMDVAAEILLLEANQRALAESKGAACHIVGLGLGVWQVDHCQSQIYVDCYGKAIRRMQGQLGCIKSIYFSYIRGVNTCDGVSHGELINGIEVYFGQRNPNEADAFASGSDTLLVTQYAWDGNSFPGNEYWMGSLAASGDPAAACCSTIPQLQNPDINRERLCGGNTHKV